MSMLSSCSVESDWSDEELDELEKMFGRYRESLQFADFLGNENPRIAKPQISRTPAFGYRCLLKLFQILFTILIGNCLPISIQKIVTI